VDAETEPETAVGVIIPLAVPLIAQLSQERFENEIEKAPLLVTTVVAELVAVQLAGPPPPPGT
jgi:hypothetical protein